MRINRITSGPESKALKTHSLCRVGSISPPSWSPAPLPCRNLLQVSPCLYNFLSHLKIKNQCSCVSDILNWLARFSLTLNSSLCWKNRKCAMKERGQTILESMRKAELIWVTISPASSLWCTSPCSFETIKRTVAPSDQHVFGQIHEFFHRHRVSKKSTHF